MRTFRLDFSAARSLGKIQQMGDGGLRIPARLSRTGILEYTYAQGGKGAEYRSPAEVFSPDSLDSFRGVTVTKGHPSQGVNGDNWKDVAVGHVAEDVRADGPYVAATVVVKDPGTVADILAGTLTELSCGYTCKVDNVEGEHEGQHYDSVQTEIRGNHVAIGPKDWGRAGNDVRLYLDDKGQPTKGKEIAGYNVYGVADCGLENTMKKTTDTTEVKKTDNAEPEAITAPSTPAQVEVIPLALYEQTLAERDAAKAEVAALTAKAETQAAAFDAKVEKRIALVERAKSFLAADYTYTGKSDSQIMADCIASSDREFKADGRSNDYLEARFDSLKVEDKSAASRAAVMVAVDNAAIVEMKRDARADMIEANRNAWKAGRK